MVLTRTSGRASAMPAGEKLAAFAATGATLAIHLSIHVLDKVVAELTPFYGADCPVAVVYRASWPDERIIRATLGTIAAEVAQAADRAHGADPGRQGAGRRATSATARSTTPPISAASGARHVSLPDISRRCPTSRRAKSGWPAPARAIRGC